MPEGVSAGAVHVLLLSEDRVVAMVAQGSAVAGSAVPGADKSSFGEIII